MCQIVINKTTIKLKSGSYLVYKVNTTNKHIKGNVYSKYLSDCPKKEKYFVEVSRNNIIVDIIKFQEKLINGLSAIFNFK